MGARRYRLLKRREARRRKLKRAKIESPAWLYDLFNSLNINLFDGQLPSIPIIVALPGKDWCSRSIFHPSMTVITISPKSIERGLKDVERCLLHEMVHQYAWIKTGDSDQKHCKLFVEVASAIRKKSDYRNFELGAHDSADSDSVDTDH